MYFVIDIEYRFHHGLLRSLWSSITSGRSLRDMMTLFSTANLARRKLFFSLAKCKKNHEKKVLMFNCFTSNENGQHTIVIYLKGTIVCEYYFLQLEGKTQEYS